MSKEITQEEHEDLKKLLLYSSEIYETLNTCNNNNAVIRQKLRELFQKEDQIYCKYKDNPEKLQHVLNYLIVEPTLANALEQIESGNSLLVTRVNHRFYEMYLTYYFKCLINGIKPTNAPTNIYEKYLDFNVELDFVKTVLKNLENYLSNPEYDCWKMNLIDFRNCLLSIYHSLEMSFINKSSDEEQTVLLEAKSITYLKENPTKRERDLQASRMGIMDLIVAKHISNLKSTYDFSSIIAKIVIESAKSFYNEEDIKELYAIADETSYDKESISKFRDIISIENKINCVDAAIKVNIPDNIKLSYEDIKLVAKLHDISSQIYDIYEILSNLEINNQKNSDEYKAYVQILEKILHEEKKIYAKIGFNPKKASYILLYLSGYEQYDIARALDSIKRSEKEEIIINRMIVHFHQIVSEKAFEDDELYDGFDEELSEEENEAMIEFTESLSESDEEENYEEDYLENSKIDNAIEFDIINTILKLINDCLANESNEVQTYLIRIKYHMIYAFKYLEQSLLKENFTVPETLFWYAKVVSEHLENGSASILQEAKDYISMDLLSVEKTELLELDNADFNDLDDYIQTLVTSIIVRSALLFLSSGNQKKVLQKIKEELETEVSTPEIKTFMNNIINGFDSDSNKPFILSLRNPNEI